MGGRGWSNRLLMAIGGSNRPSRNAEDGSRMQLGLREYEGASLVVGHTDALPASMKEIIEISSVKTPRRKRRMGLASALLSQVCAEADRERIVMILQPGPKAWLQQFYGSHGFAVIQTEPVVLMARPPNLNAVMLQEPNGPSEQHRSRIDG